MRRRRLIILLAVFSALAAATGLAWVGLDLPPPRLALKYGAPPAGGPTGEATVICGHEFMRVDAGYCRVERILLEREGDALGRIFRPLGIPIGEADVFVREYTWDRWCEVKGDFWISKTPLGWMELRSDLGRKSILLNETTWSHPGTAGAFRFADADEVWLTFATGAVPENPNAEYTEWGVTWMDSYELDEDGDPKQIRASRPLPIGEFWRKHVGYRWLEFDDQSGDSLFTRVIWIPPSESPLD